MITVPSYGVKLVTKKKHYFPLQLDSDLSVLAFLIHLGLHEQPQEQFHVIFLSTDLWITGHTHVATGSNSKSIVHPPDVFRAAILANAHRIILAHNHPFGSVAPSSQDIELTSKLVTIGRIIDIPIVEHLILSEDEHFSFTEHKLL